MTKSGTSALTLTAANTFTGDLNVSGGTLTLTGVNAVTGDTSITGGTLALNGAGRIDSTTQVTVGGGSTFDISQITGSAVVVDNLQGAGGLVLGSSSGVQIGQGAFSGVISGSAPVEKNTANTLTLSGVNTYTGATTVNAGTLVLGVNNAISASSGVVLNGTGTLNATTAGATLKSLNGAGGVNVGSQTLTLSNGGSYAGIIAGTNGQLELTGGILTLGGVNSYSGVTTLTNNAKLVLGVNAAVSASSGVVLNDTAVLDATAAGATIKTLGGVSGTTANVGSQTLTLSAASGSYAGNITGSGSLAITGGTFALNGVNTYTGATTLAGTSSLTLGVNNAILASSGVVLNGTSTLDATAAGATLKSLNGAGSVKVGSQTLTLSNGGTYSGIIAGTNGQLEVTGGVLTLGGVNTYTGATRIGTGATLALDPAGRINASTSVTLGGTAIFDLSGTTGSAVVVNDLQGTSSGSKITLGSADVDIKQGSYAGQIDGGAGALTKSGAGLLEVTGGGVSVTGPVNVLGGELRVVNSGSEVFATSDDFGVSGATLSGQGSLAANSFAFASSAILTPGNGAVGTLNLTGNTTFADTSYEVDIVGNGSGGFVNDLVAVTGTVTFNGAGNEIAVRVPGGQFVEGDFTILTATGGIAATLADIAVIPPTVLTNRQSTNLLLQNAGQDLVLQLAGNLNLNLVWAGASGDNWTGANKWTEASANDSTFVNGDAVTFGSATVGQTVVVDSDVLVASMAVDADHTFSGVGSIGSTSHVKNAAWATSPVVATEKLEIANNITATFTNAGGLNFAGGIELGSASEVEFGQGFAQQAGGELNSIISGAGNVTKSGTDTLILGGTQLYTGDTTINDGKLALAPTGSIAASKALILNGGIFDISATDASIQNLRGVAGTSIELGGRTLTVANALLSADYAGVIKGTGNLVLNNSQALTLSGVNTYTGATTVSAGTLALYVNNAISASSGVTLGGSATLDISEAGATLKSLNGSGTVDSNSPGPQVLTITNGGDFAGSITGQELDLVVFGGVLTLRGNNGYEGGDTTIGEATLALVGSAFIGNAPTRKTGVELAHSGAIFDLSQKTGEQSISYLKSIYASSEVKIGASATLQVDSGDFAGILSGSGAFKKDAADTLTLSGDSTYFTGGATLNGGTVVLRSDTALGVWSQSAPSTDTAGVKQGRVDVTGDSTVRIDSDRTLRNHFFTNNSTLTFDIPTGKTLSFDGVTTFGNNDDRGGALSAKDPGQLVFTGGGNLVFTNNADIREGGGAIAAFSADIGGNVQLDLSQLNSVRFEGNRALYEGGAIQANAWRSNSNATLTLGNNVSFVGNSSGYDGGAVFAQAYVNVDVSVGTNALFDSNTADAGGALMLSDVQGNMTLALRGNTFFKNNIANDVGGAIRISASNSATTLSFGTAAGHIAFSGNRAGNSGGAIHASSGTTLNITGNNNVYFGDGDSLGGSIGITKNGAGFVQFIGSSAFTGDVTVDAGTFRVVNSGAQSFNTGSSTFAVNTGATFSGGGRVAANSFAFDGSTLSPDTLVHATPVFDTATNSFGPVTAPTGDRIGTLELAGNVTLSGAILAIDIDGTANRSDLIKVAGNADFSSGALNTVSVNYFSSDGQFHSGAWKIFETTGSLTVDSTVPTNPGAAFNISSGPRQLAELDFSRAANEIWVVLQDQFNVNLTWQGGDGQWSASNWECNTGSGLWSNMDFLDGDSVTFDGRQLSAETENTINLTKDVKVASMLVKTGPVTEYIFTGAGAITHAGSVVNATGGSVAPVALTQDLTIENYAKATFKNRGGIDFAGGIKLGGTHAEIEFGQGFASSLDSIISGDGNVIKSGSGRLELHDVQEYTGKTLIKDNGSLALAAGAKIEGSSYVSLEDTATFDISATNATIQALYGDAGTTVQLGDRTLTVQAVAFDSIFDGDITGSGNFALTGTPTGPRIFSLGGVSTYTGTTTVSGNNTLALSGVGSIAESSKLTLNDEAVFDISSTTAGATVKALHGEDTTEVILGDQTLTLGGGNHAGVIDSFVDGGFTVDGGTLKLSGVGAAFEGTARVANGALELLGNGSLASAKVVTLDDYGTTLDIKGVSTSESSLAKLIGGPGSSVILGGKTLKITGAGTAFAGVISGLGGLTIGDSANATLGGTNTYTDWTRVVQDGSLTLTGLGSIAASKGIDLGNRAEFDIAGTDAGAAVQILNGNTGSSVILGDQTLTVTKSGVFDGVISGDGGLTFTGDLLILGDANTYTGATLVTGDARLALGNSGSIAHSSSVTLEDRAIFDVSSPATAEIKQLYGAADTEVRLGTASFGTQLVVTDGGVFDGRITGFGNSTGALKVGGGVLTLGGRNTYEGDTEIVPGATLEIAGALGWQSLGSPADYAGTVANDGTLVFNSVLAQGISGAITGDGVLVKRNSGVLTLSAANTYTGQTTVEGGVLALAGAGTIASSAGVVLGNNATFDISGTDSGATLKALNTSGSGVGALVNLGNRELTLQGASNIAGTIAGPRGSLTVNNSATVTLSGVNTYGGPTTVETGSFLDVTGLLGSGNYVGALINKGRTTFDQDQRQELSGVVSGNGTIVKSGDGALVLSAANTFDGILRISEGVVEVTGRLGANSARDRHLGTIEIGAGTELLLNQAEDQELSGELSGTGTLRKKGAAQLVISSATNSFDGPINLAAGSTLVTGTLGNNGLTSNLTSTIVNNGTDLHFAQSADQELSGVISGTGTLTVEGAPGTTFTLSAANTYKGSTFLKGAGDLFLTHSLAAGAGTLNTGLVVHEGEGVLRLDGGIVVNNSIVLNTYQDRKLGVDSGERATLSGYIGLEHNQTGPKAGRFEKVGEGTLTLNRADALVSFANGILIDGVGAGEWADITNDVASTLELNGTTHFTNALFGTGTLLATLPDRTTEFSFGPDVGNAFEGTFALPKGRLVLKANDENALENATLLLGNGQAVHPTPNADATLVINGERVIGNLITERGGLEYKADPLAAEGRLTVNNLDITRGVIVDVTGITADLDLSVPDANQNIFDYWADGDAGQTGNGTYPASSSYYQKNIVKATGTVLGTDGDIQWKNWSAVPTDASRDIVENSDLVGQITFGVTGGVIADEATAQTYGLDKGIYLGYGLKEIEAFQDKTVHIDASSAKSTLPSLFAKLTGDGSFHFIGAAGQEVLLGNSASDYKADTTVETLTIRLATDNAFGEPAALTLLKGGVVNLDGNALVATTLTGNDASDTGFVLGTETAPGTLTVTDGEFDGYITGHGDLQLRNITAAYGVSRAAGLLVLSGTGDYTGATNVLDGGELRSAVDGVFSVNSTYTVSGNNGSGTRSLLNVFGTGQTIGNLLGDGIVALGDEGHLFVKNAAGVFSGDITEAGHFTKDGAADYTLSGNNSYTGVTTVLDGTLILTGKLGYDEITGENNYNGAIKLTNGNFKFDTDQDHVFGGDIEGEGRFDIIQGRLALRGANDGHVGALTVQGGVLDILEDSNVGTGTRTLGNATLELNGGDGTVYAKSWEITGSFHSGNPTDGSVIHNPNNVELKGDLTGLTDTTLTKKGLGELKISGSNDAGYAGILEVAQGLVEISTDDNLGSPVTGNLLHTGATLRLAGAEGTVYAKGWTLHSALGDDAETATVETPFDVELGGLLDGASLRKTGPGTLTLSNESNDYTNSIVEEGTLRIFKDLNLGSGTGNQLAAGATLWFDGAADEEYTKGWELLAGGNPAFVRTEDGAIFNGSFTGAGSLEKIGAGILALGGANTHVNTTIAEGALAIDDDANLGTGINTINDAATLILAANTYDKAWTLDSGEGFVEVTAAGDTAQLNGLLGGAGSLVKTGEGRLLLTSQVNAYENTRIAEGVLAIVSDANIGSGTNLIDGGSLEFTGPTFAKDWHVTTANGSVITPGIATYNGVFSGDEGALLTKQGVGTLVVHGRVDVDAHIATGTLAGRGVLNKVTFAEGTVIAPGNGFQDSLGTLTLGDGILTQFEGITLSVDTRGRNDSDLVVVKGNAEFGLVTPNTVNVFNNDSLALNPDPHNKWIDGRYLLLETTDGELSAGDLSQTTFKYKNVVVNPNHGRLRALLEKIGDTQLVLTTYASASLDLVWNANEITDPSATWNKLPNSLENWLEGEFAREFQDGDLVTFRDVPGVIKDVTVGDNLIVGHMLVESGNFSFGGASIHGIETAIDPDTGLSSPTFGPGLSGDGRLVIRNGAGAAFANHLDFNAIEVDGNASFAALVESHTPVAIGRTGLVTLLDGGRFGANDALDIANDGVLAFERLSSNYTYAGAISGEGSVRIGTDTTYGQGATVTLTATNDYAGTTSVIQATLSIGSDDNIGRGFNFIDEGTVKLTGTSYAKDWVLSRRGGTLDNAGPVDFNGVISGTGMLTKKGAGELVLTAENIYAGDTTVSGGVLRITGPLSGGSALAQTGRYTGDIHLDGADIVFDQEGDQVLTGVVNYTGGGTFEKRNANTLYLSNTSSGTGHRVGAFLNVSGDTVVDNTLMAGTRLVNGTAATTARFTGADVSAVRIENNAGSEMTVRNVSATIVDNYGQLSLRSVAEGGNGVFNRAGAELRLQPGGASIGVTLYNEGLVNFANFNDVLTVSGLDNINGGTGQYLIDVDFAVPERTDHVEVTAGGVVKGRHAFFLRDKAGLETISLKTAVPLITSTGGAAIDMSGATVAAYDADTGALLESGIYRLGVAGSGNSILKVVGYSTIGQAAINTIATMASSWFSQLDNLDRRMGEIRQDGAQSNDFWVRGYAQQTNVDLGIRGVSEFREMQYGADIGYDRQFDLGDAGRFNAGVFLGYQSSRRTMLDPLHSKGDGESIAFGGYATWFDQNGWYVDGTVKGQIFRNDYDADRRHGVIDNYAVGFSIEAGKRFTLDKAWFIEPGVQFAYTHVFSETFTVDTMRVMSSDSDILRYFAGVKAGRDIKLDGWGTIQPSVRAGIEYQDSLGGAIRCGGERFVPTTDGVRGVIGLGFGWQFTPAQQVHLEYEASFGEKYDRPWSINAGYRIRF